LHRYLIFATTTTTTTAVICNLLVLACSKLALDVIDSFPSCNEMG